MVKLREGFRKLFSVPSPTPPGLYHYRRELADRMLRLHLRVEHDGTGLLSVNANGVLHLNETAVALVKRILDGDSRDAALSNLRRVYRGSAEAIGSDWDRILAVIRTLETSEDACPFAALDVPLVPPFGKEVSAPYRADLALTYACNNACQHCYVARRPGEVTTMALEEWKQVLEKLWSVGVPHVCFTGGEATLSLYLVDLVEAAEDIGIITGLLTNGRKLADRDFVRRLCGAGLDHVQITIESHNAAVHDEMVGCPGAHAETVAGIRNAIDDDIYLVTNTTLCSLNVAEIADTLRFLSDLGVRQVACNSLIYTGKAPASGLGIAEADLAPILGEITDRAEELGLRFIWYTPTHYCTLNPTMLGVGFKRCTAAEYNICIEPDGQVLPCQSYYQPAGHILKDEWESIWNSPLFRGIRSRAKADEACRSCPDFEVCGSGCPLSDGQQFVCADSVSEG